MFIYTYSIAGMFDKPFNRYHPCYKSYYNKKCERALETHLHFGPSEPLHVIDKVIEKHGEEILFPKDGFKGLGKIIIGEEDYTFKSFEKYVMPNFNKLNKDNVIIKKHFNSDIDAIYHDWMDHYQSTLREAKLLYTSDVSLTEFWKMKSFPENQLGILKKMEENIQQDIKFGDHKKKARKDLELAQTVTGQLSKLNNFKVNICNIRGLESFNDAVKEFGDYSKVINSEGNDALLCALKNGDEQLAEFLIHNKKYNAEMVNNYLSHLIGGSNNISIAEDLLSDKNIKPHINKEYSNVYDLYKSLKDISGSCDGDLFNGLSGNFEGIQKIINDMYFHSVKELLVQHKGSITGDSDLGKLIIRGYKKGIDINYVDPSSGKTIVHYLAEHSTESFMFDIRRKLTKDKNMDFMIQDKQGNTPAHIAAINGNFSTAHEILDYTYVSWYPDMQSSIYTYDYNKKDKLFKIKNKNGDQVMKLLRKQKKDKKQKELYKEIKHYKNSRT